MKTSTLFGVIIALILGIGWYFYSNTTPPTFAPSQNIAGNDSQNPNAATNSSTGGNIDQAIQSAPLTATIVYGSNGFSPSTITIAKGGTVAFTNEGDSKMWVASDVHPTHEGYAGTTKNQHCPDTAGVAFDQCAVSRTYSFTFQKVGTWNYHNHTNASEVGVIIVK